MDSMTLQADEIEALTAIYGDDLAFNDVSRKSFGIDLHPFSDESSHPHKHEKHMKVEFRLPAGYPATEPPCYTISAPWMSRNKKLQLTSALDEIYVDNAGEAVLYMWIEKCREFLNEGTCGNIPDENPDEEEDLPNMSFEFSSQVLAEDVAKTKIHISHGEPVTDRKSAFQAHVARVSNVAQAKLMIEHIKDNKKLATATHNISAYRISGGPHGTCFQDCDDDGENQAGGRLLHLLQILGVEDVVIVVSRWYGGINLGADRFKHINHVARDLIEKCGFLQTSANAAPQTKDASKKKKAK